MNRCIPNLLHSIALFFLQREKKRIKSAVIKCEEGQNRDFRNGATDVVCNRAPSVAKGDAISCTTTMQNSPHFFSPLSKKHSHE